MNPMKRELSKVMDQIRPFLVEGKVDMGEFEKIYKSVGFSAPENEKIFWAELIEYLNDELPRPDETAPAWVREVSDIMQGKK